VATYAKTHTKELNEKVQRELEKSWEDAALKCAEEWDAYATSGRTPYMDRKLIGELYGARIKANEPHEPILVVPARDIDGRLWNYQRIYAKKLSRGDKFFCDGARIDGLFHVLPPLGQGSEVSFETIYLCEGFATACSVQVALGEGHHIVVAAFNAGNLQEVATALKGRYPSAAIIVCADNDAFTLQNGKPRNVGLEKGRRAAGSVGGRIVWPIFRSVAKGFTDFNDLHAAEGIDRVRDQILHPENYVKGIQPMCLEVRGKKVVPPTEKQICEYILEFFGEKIVRQDKSVFVYTGTHWEELGPTGIDRIKQMIQVAANGLLGARDLDSYWKYLVIHCPVVPGEISLFQPNPCTANFLNGTLHFWKNGDKRYHVEFRKHDPRDYLTSCLPFEKPNFSPGEPLPPAPLFDAMIERLWSSAPDKTEIHKLAHELIGGVLCPAFPTIVIFHGLSDSGKSTLIKLLVRLVRRENVSSVQLCDMQGFNMESMIGKLVNFDTDIDLNRPMNDSEVKKIIDRVPRRVRRKGLADVYAYLPALHLFAANGLPKSLDGRSHAYGKRFILVHTTAVLQPGEKTLDFEQEILDSELPGVLARGLAGLYRLLDNYGQYTVPESSYESVRQMEKESDLIGQFLSDVEAGEVQSAKSQALALGENCSIPRPELWVCFQNWQKDCVTDSRARIGKITFFSEILQRGIAPKHTKTGDLFEGIGVQVLKNPIA
jgi:phage/plasmid-associated DNA primase